MRTIIRNPSFRRLWFSQIGLALGDAVMQMGLLEVFRRHGFNERVETAKLFFAVCWPGAVLGPLAMAYLDRWPRRSVLVVSDAIRSVVVVGIMIWMWPLLTSHGAVRGMFAVYALITVIGAITTFYYPARYALLPSLVPADKLIQANTLFTTSLAVAGIGGRALGGFVAEWFGPGWAVATNAAAYLLSVMLLLGIRRQAPVAGTETKEEQKGGWNELRTGLEYLWTHQSALPLVIMSGVFAFLAGVLIVTIVGYGLDTLKLGTGGLGYLMAAAGVGAAIGIVAVGRGKSWAKSILLPFVQLIVGGIMMWLLSMTVNPWLAAVWLVVLGAVAATALIPIDAKLQEEVDNLRLGAVFAARGMWTSLTMLVAFWLQFGSAFFRNTPPPTMLLWLGGGTVVTALLLLLVLRRRRS
ncbi:MAG: MFS transporter [Verrucomicrobiia bacterium]